MLFDDRNLSSQLSDIIQHKFIAVSREITSTWGACRSRDVTVSVTHDP